MINSPYCLVLGGGGAKGVYHIGVWQALQELDIPVNAFIGNSIGAVMAAFLAAGAEDKLLEIAKSINLQSLVRLNKDEALADGESLKDQSLAYWQGVYKNIVEKRGIDTSPMRDLLESGFNETEVRNSGFDFGVTTVNVSDFKPREVFIEKMQPGQLVNYIMASAAFPGFQQPIIEGKKYVDGGLYSNLPYAMAKRRGYRKIILVDISGIGMNRRPKTEGTETVLIKNSIDMGNAFEFDREFIEKFLLLGYLDTLRTFGSLHGYRYFLEPNPIIETQLTTDVKTINRLNEIGSSFPESMTHDRRNLLKILEVCAEIFDIERICKYSYQSLAGIIQENIMATEQVVKTLISNQGLNSDAPSHKILDAFIREVFSGGSWSENPYYYQYLLMQFKPNKAIGMAESTLRKLHPELAILDVYRSLSLEVLTAKND